MTAPPNARAGGDVCSRLEAWLEPGTGSAAHNLLLADAIAEIERLRLTGWQPIATAPKVRWLLLSLGGRMPLIGLIREDGSCGLWQNDRPTFGKPCPTHWTPLPAPPEVTP